jgi:hypothetical protein
MKRSSLLLTVLAVVTGALLTACPGNPTTQAKASSLLLAQVALRQQQIASPTQARLQEMQSYGMRTDNLGVQRVFIYLTRPLTTEQGNELRSLGLVLYPESWIPPVGNHPEGFMLAEMPVDRLDSLAAKDYVVRIDTAERKSEPQGGAKPG